MPPLPKIYLLTTRKPVLKEMLVRVIVIAETDTEAIEIATKKLSIKDPDFFAKNCICKEMGNAIGYFKSEVICWGFYFDRKEESETP